MAEALAFGSLLVEGIPVRLSGQDARRGTFNQRHSVLIDTENEKEYVPLCQHLRPIRRGLKLTIPSFPKLPCWALNMASAATIQMASAVGSAVRRFRQRRASHHRSVHRGRRRQVGTAFRTGDAACRTDMKARGRNTPADASNATCNSPRKTISRSASLRPRRSISICCGGRRCATGASR